MEQKNPRVFLKSSNLETALFFSRCSQSVEHLEALELGAGGSWESALLPIIKTILDWVSLTSIRNAIILWRKFLESSKLISAWGMVGVVSCFKDKLTTHLIGSVIISNISNFLSLHLNILWTIPTIVIQLSSNKNPASLPLQQPLAQTVKSFQHFLLLLSLPSLHLTDRSDLALEFHRMPDEADPGQ